MTTADGVWDGEAPPLRGRRRFRGERTAQARAPLASHLRELRRRLVLASGGLLAGGVVGWVLYPQVFALLQAPLVAVADERDSLVALNFVGVATSFDMQIKVSLFLGVLITSPWWIYQLWAFITPGLTRKEHRYALGFLAAAVPLFLAGAGAAWAVLPNAVHMLTEFTPAGVANLIDAQSYLTFVMRLLLAFGLAFLLPVILVGLNFAGLLRARSMRHSWRWATMLAFLFAAVMTPTPDAISMLVLAFPVVALYFAAVGIATVHDRRVDRRRAAEGLPPLFVAVGDGDD